MAKDEQFHLAAEAEGVVFVIFAIHWIGAPESETGEKSGPVRSLGPVMNLAR
jgi:hypothetical protein